MLEIFDTKAREKRALVPMRDHTIYMYTCGPTVYNYAHIGNFRTYVFEDLLRRTIKFFGMKVYQVMNLTDVDDKTIKGALERKLTLKAFTDIYKKAFFHDLDVLNIERAEEFPSATDYIGDMIEMIQTLIKKGIAYESGDGNVFYSIAKFPRYGCLSHLDMSTLKAGASERVDHDEYHKEAISDFVLWKAYDPKRDGDIYWPSPYGKGRPGWHIECSAMATKILGSTIDLHVGGCDNMFPHHENEIAQSEGCTGKEFSRYWMHSEHLVVDGKKMSKSLGNFFTIKDLLEKGFTGREIRYLLLSTHYRSKLNFTIDGLTGARNTLHRIDDFRKRMEGADGEDDPSIHAEIDLLLTNFKASLGDDLNISPALAALFDFIRAINSLADKERVGREGAKKVLEVLDRLDQVLGIFQGDEAVIPDEITEKAKAREVARKSKRWDEADRLRHEIEEDGYIVEDVSTGFTIKKK